MKWEKKNPKIIKMEVAICIANRFASKVTVGGIRKLLEGA